MMNQTSKKIFALALVFLTAACSSSTIDSEPVSTKCQLKKIVDIHLYPANKTYWQADFSWDRAVRQLDFVRGSTKRRPDRVRLVDQQFELFSTDTGDHIRRKDGEEFCSVSILEPVTIENPPTGYLPFAQFGDGGLLLHTGRFHVHAGSCPDPNRGACGSWQITVDSGDAGRMIVHGAIVEDQTASFVDSADGTKIYIGNGAVIASDQFLTVIDSALPDNVSVSLNRLLPQLMDHYGDRLGEIAQKQMLFASYNVPGDVLGSSIKGGTLPNQVFMHFEGAQIPEKASQPGFEHFLSWFFAHEAAHLHQHHREAEYDRRDSWIHEGAAEAFSYHALSDLNETPDSYIRERVSHAKSACVEVLSKGSLRSVLDRNGPFQAYYDCGLIIHLVAGASALRNGNGDIFSVWQEFTEQVQNGASWSTDTFVATVRNLGDSHTADFIEAVVVGELDDPLVELDQVLQENGF